MRASLRTGLGKNGLLFVGRGDVDLSGVRFIDGGAFFSSIAAMRAGQFVLPMLDLNGASSARVTGVVVEPNFGHGLAVRRGVFEGNLVYKPATGFRCGGSAVVANNVVFSVRDKPKNLDFTDEDAGFWMFGSRVTVVNNNVAGSTGPLFGFPGFSLTRDKWANNSGHSGVASSPHTDLPQSAADACETTDVTAVQPL